MRPKNCYKPLILKRKKLGITRCVKARMVRQQLWARKVALPAGDGASIDVTCVIAREIAALSNAKAIEWCLLSNREADTTQAIVELIDWYRACWEIEILCDVLKNACRVEALQPGSITQLERALALFKVVAWRITYLMRIDRTYPDLDAKLFFDSDEIEATYLLHGKVPPAKPRLNDVLRQVACIGGFLARKSDVELGVKTIWLGLKDVHVAVNQAWRLADLCITRWVQGPVMWKLTLILSIGSIKSRSVCPVLIFAVAAFLIPYQ